jgi:peptide/nickel transport system substrate-binding protein
LAVAAFSLVACSEPAERSSEAVGEIPLPADVDTSRAPVGQSGGALVLATISGPKTFNPLVARETSSTDILGRMFDSLVTMDNETQEVRPALAKTWEHSPDGLAWTFHLRRGLRWSDGHPLTADDVVFTFRDVVYNPDIPTDISDILKVGGAPFAVTKTDSLTVQVELPGVYAPFLTFFGGVSIVPAHTLRGFVTSGDFESAYGVGTPPAQLVCSGPFVLETFRAGERTVLGRNPYYWRADSTGTRLPYLERIVFLIVRDMDAQLLKFQAGETDVLDGVRSEDYALLVAGEAAGDYAVHNRGPSLGQLFVWFNLNPGTNPVTGDPLVDPVKQAWFRQDVFRRAMAHAIDKRGIIETVYLGLAEPQWGNESPGNALWYDPDVPRYPFDLVAADRLLRSIGLVDRDGDGVREGPEGHRVSFTLITNTGNTVREAIASILRADWAKVGVEVNIRPVEFNLVVTKIDETYDYEACLLGLTGGDLDPASGMSVWLSSGRMHQWYPRQPEPATSWEARIDSLMEAQVKTLDVAARRTMYNEVQRLIAQHAPYLFLVRGHVLIAVRDRFRNLRPTILRHHTLWNADEIYVAAPAS